jgi:hypothetical protein
LEEDMHANIGRQTLPDEAPRDLRAFYDNRAAFLETSRRTGVGIDYDFYRARASRERARFMRAFLRGLAPKLRPLARPLAAAAILLAAIWMMPTAAEDCTDCAQGATGVLSAIADRSNVSSEAGSGPPRMAACRLDVMPD